jgi:hypothetical protein
MHRSRFAGFIVDCRTEDLDGATGFWGRALGMKTLTHSLDGYSRLDPAGRDVTVEVQSVSHESRVHIDIETDNLEAEVARLESLGASRVAQVKTWWVMQAPTGQRFCVVLGKDLDQKLGVASWD